MKLGILGGTFDPIHLGHLRAAEEIGEMLNLEKVYLIPTGTPPHKGQYHLTEFPHRLEMTIRASKISPLLDVWDIEGKRPGLSYSIETLTAFHHYFGSKLELFFIIGMDAFIEIKTWKAYQNLFHVTSFVVINRPGYSKERFSAFLETLDIDGGWDENGIYVCHPSGNVLLHKNTTFMDISATRIRKLVAEKKSIRFLVPEVVGEYIEKAGLYQNL